MTPIRSSMKICTLLLLSLALSLSHAFAAPPDAAPDYETLTTGLGIGILFEPQLGAGAKTLINDHYLTSYGDEIERKGFQSVRLRIDPAQFTANTTGTYPHLQLTNAFFDDLQTIVDDLLRRHNNTMYVLISPGGLESGSADDETQMADYWAQIANRYKDYTHRLIFNLMNEPYYRVGEFTSLAQITSLYNAVTNAVRPTNPTRYLVYLQMQDITVQPDGTKTEGIPFSNAGPGESDFNHMTIPASAGTNYIVDFHVLGNENAAGTAKRLALLRQAYEFRAATGIPVWTGAWNWGAWDTTFDNSQLTIIADEMKALGIPGTYLMFNSSNTSIFDGAAVDRDVDGVFNEWTKPDIADLVASRNPIFWQKNKVETVTSYHAVADAYGKSGAFGDEALSGELEEIVARNIRAGYMKFNVNRLPAGTVTSAKLRLRTNSLSFTGFAADVRPATNTTWQERTVSWNNGPARNGVSFGSVMISAQETWYEWTVTSGISANGLYTFVLTSDGTGTTSLLRFYSRDADNDPSWLYGPELIVTVNPTVPANSAPIFTTAPVKPNASVDVAYAATLATNVSDANSDTLRFGKSTGPAWLTVKQDGTLVGTPSSSDLGLNTWNVEVSDSRGGTATATMSLLVTSGSTPVAPTIITDPVSQTVLINGTVTFSVTASGSPTPTYQWAKGGTPISGATNDTLTLTNVQPGDAGSYTVTVTNSAGSAVSSAATLTVSLGTPPTISVQPQDQSNAVGGTVTFSVTGTGLPTPTYQWSKNGVAIPGATANTLPLTNLQSADAGSYSVTLSNTAGTVTSRTASLTIAVGPAIITQPQSLTAVAGTSISFTVSASGSPAPTYQWTKNGANISGATSATLTFASVQSTDAGTFAVVVRNSAGTVTSASVTLTVNNLPVITLQPQSQSTFAGGSATFNVSATGTTPMTFQWLKNGAAIADATGSTLTLSGVQSANAGTYSVTITNAAGSVTSDGATLTVTGSSTSSGSGSSSGGGGGGGAPTPAFIAALSLALLLRFRTRR